VHPLFFGAIKPMPATVRDILNILEELAPARLAADWDNCGLMVGQPEGHVRKAALALDPSLENVQAAHDYGAQLLLTHHPLIFKPLKNINLDDPTAAVVALALKLDLTIVAAHTNLDAAADGVSWVLARKLGLDRLQVLQPQKSGRFKLVVFVPLGYEDRVRKALFETGAGRIGAYSGCSFSGRGEGTWTPDQEARPFQGRPGQRQRSPESRLEVLLSHGQDFDEIITVLRRVHPYQEPAFDIYPLVSSGDFEGFGCMGRFEKPIVINDLIKIVKEKLGIAHVKVAAAPSGRIETAALVGGSGGSFVRPAKNQGAQVLISGDFGYHHAREAEQLGLGLIDAGHFSTERPVLDSLAERLFSAVRSRSLEVDFQVLSGEKDPWLHMEG